MKLHLAWKLTLPDHVLDLAWARDSNALVAAPATGALVSIERASAQTRHTLQGHSTGNTSISISPTHELLASTGQDGLVRLWNLDTGTATFEHPAAASNRAWGELVRFSPTGLHWASAAGKTLRIWDAHGTLHAEYSDHTSTLSALAWRPDGLGIASTSYGNARLFRAKSNVWEKTAYENLRWKGSLISLRWSPNGRFIAAGSQESTVQFWRLPHRPGDELFMSGYATKVRELSWDASSRFLASGGGPHITVWDVSGRGPAGTRPQQLNTRGARVTQLAYHPSAPLLACGDSEGDLSLWSISPPSSHSQLCLHPLRSPLSALAWSNDGNALAAGTEDGSLALFELSPA